MYVMRKVIKEGTLLCSPVLEFKMLMIWNVRVFTDLAVVPNIVWVYF